ncbi:hypothetical protein NM688_g5771 [Phlebia brevispora]|uniref:Uncharacterized protein n=1 Tax=Phlebia brevispora TaxID=194682 RepID=A0ACC1SQ31_9APHY|nr:hypothetical protein NM688_g5771 [Phlebia brevispora]
MEFYLVDDLECDLVVFHPYRTLMTLCGKEGIAMAVDAEAGEVGVGVQDGARYWGTGEGKLELQEPALQLAWFIINDTYRSDLCLLYPPHLIAIAAIYLTLVFHPGTRDALHLQDGTSSQSNPRRSSRSTSSIHHKKPAQDIVGIAQEIISLYTLWGRYKEDGADATARTSFTTQSTTFGLKRTAASIMRSGSVLSGGTSSSRAGTPGDDGTHRQVQRPPRERPAVITPTFLTQLLLEMRETRMNDMAHPSTGRPAVYDKRLERAQAAG